jgi:hypothetical protein
METNLHNSEMNQPKLVPNKIELAKEIQAYIVHSRYIIFKSPNKGYRSVKTLMHLDMCNDLLTLVKNPEGISMKDVCQFTLILRKHLEGILPCPNNNSFQSSFQKLHNIFTQCTNYLTSLSKA